MENKYQLAIKFFTETKNEEELGKAYIEIETFMQTFEQFLFYYCFDPTDIDTIYLDSLSNESKYYYSFNRKGPFKGREYSEAFE